MLSSKNDQIADPPKYTSLGRYGVFTIERVTQLVPHIGAWTHLASSTPRPNVYYDPKFLIPNLEHVEHRPFVLLLIYEETSTDQAHTLVAFAPFTVNAPTHKRFSCDRIQSIRAAGSGADLSSTASRAAR